MTTDDYDPDAILADPDAHPIHKMYATINIGIRDRGERWSKCPNCGEPYQLTEEWGDSTVCSPECFEDFRSYLMGGGL
jgi:transposase